jgi:hypothetical protein
MKLIFPRWNIFSFKKLLFYSKILATIYGLNCFKYPSETFKLSLLAVLAVILNLFFNFFKSYQVIMVMFVTPEPVFGTNNLIDSILYGTYLLSFISSNIVIIISFLMREEVFKMMKKFEEFNQEAQNLGKDVNESRDVALILSCFVFKIFALSSIGFMMYAVNGEFLASLTVSFTTIGIYIPLEIFIGIMYLVLRKIHYVVNALR